MKYSGYIIALIFVLSICDSIRAQYNIQYTNLESKDILIFTRIIGDKTYHYSNRIIDDVGFGSDIITNENGKIADISWIYKINDTLFCYQLIDMWQHDDKLQLFAYTFANENRYISLLELDLTTGALSLKSNQQINEYNADYYYRFKDLIIEGKRYAIILEHIKDTNKINGIFLFKFEGDNFTCSKYIYPEPVKSYLLFDQFYDEDKKLIYFLNNKDYLKFNTDFSIFQTQEVILQRGNATYHGAESNIVGKNGNKLITYERHRPTKKNLILSRREITVLDTFQYAKEYIDFNPDEDCYVARKIFKDSCNYLFYSRSTINGFNKDYGFNIISFSKQGELLNNQVFNSDRPMAVYDIDIDEATKKISGVGQYFDDYTQFSFTADLKKGMVNTTENKVSNPGLLLNNIDNHTLHVHPGFNNTVVKIFSVNGQLLRSLNVGQEIDISWLIPGTYFVQYYFKDKIRTEKFVKL